MQREDLTVARFNTSALWRGAGPEGQICILTGTQGKYLCERRLSKGDRTVRLPGICKYPLASVFRTQSQA